MSNLVSPSSGSQSGSNLNTGLQSSSNNLNTFEAAENQNQISEKDDAIRRLSEKAIGVTLEKTSEILLEKATGLVSSKKTSNPVSEKPFPMLSTPPSKTRRRSATRSERHKPEEEEETVTIDFVEEYNKTIGSQSLQHKAERLIEKMKRLGGLIGSLSYEELDVNSARRGLAVLAGIKNNDDLKLNALNSLYALIKADPLQGESAQGLVSVILALTEHMNVANLQSETPQAQLALAKVYGAVARLIIYYQSQKQTNAITSELKLALRKVVADLAKLNQSECVKLNYHVQYALEGIIRIKDDLNYLEVTLQILFHLSMAAASYQFQTDFSAELKKALHTLDSTVKQRAKSSWYDCCLSIVPLAKGSYSNIDLLIAFQEIISKQANKQDWRFLFTSIKLLRLIVLNGKDKSIRRKALEGWETTQFSFPGILSFLNYKATKKLDFKKTHFSNTGLAKPLSASKLIQERCVEELLKIQNNSEDVLILKILKNYKSTIKEKAAKFGLKMPSKILASQVIEETDSSSPRVHPNRHSDIPLATIRKTERLSIEAERFSADGEKVRQLRLKKVTNRFSETAIGSGMAVVKVKSLEDIQEAKYKSQESKHRSQESKHKSRDETPGSL